MPSLDELWETLNTTGTAPFIAKQIDPVLLNKVRQDDPWETALPSKSWDRP